MSDLNLYTQGLSGARGQQLCGGSGGGKSTAPGPVHLTLPEEPPWGRLVAQHSLVLPSSLGQGRRFFSH